MSSFHWTSHCCVRCCFRVMHGFPLVIWIWLHQSITKLCIIMLLQGVWLTVCVNCLIRFCSDTESRRDYICVLEKRSHQLFPQNVWVCMCDHMHMLLQVSAIRMAPWPVWNRFRPVDWPVLLQMKTETFKFIDLVYPMLYLANLKLSYGFF